MVCSLGLESSLVGRSHECDYPPTVKKLPICSRPLLDPSLTSAAIDNQVKKSLSDGLSLYEIDVEKFTLASPEIIITQAQCDVCAVSEKDLASLTKGKIHDQVKVVSLEAHSLDDVWKGFLSLADILGVSEKGKHVFEKLNNRIQKIYETTKMVNSKPRVAALEWLEPLMGAGNWVPELIEKAGGENLFGSMGKHSEWIGWDQVVKSDPDIILLLPCGFGLKRARQEAQVLKKNADWFNLRAVQNNQVYLLDGNQFFNRPGPRLVESLEILAEIFHPDFFDFGHRYDGWEYLGFE